MGSPQLILPGRFLTHHPSGVSLVPRGINEIISSSASLGPCLLTFVELFSRLPLDEKT